MRLAYVCYNNRPVIEAALLWRWSRPAYEYGPDGAEAQRMVASDKLRRARVGESLFLPASICRAAEGEQQGSSLGMWCGPGCAPEEHHGRRVMGFAERQEETGEAPVRVPSHKTGWRWRTGCGRAGGRTGHGIDGRVLEASVEHLGRAIRDGFRSFRRFYIR